MPLEQTLETSLGVNHKREGETGLAYRLKSITVNNTIKAYHKIFSSPLWLVGETRILALKVLIYCHCFQHIGSLAHNKVENMMLLLYLEIVILLSCFGSGIKKNSWRNMVLSVWLCDRNTNAENVAMINCCYTKFCY